MDVLNEGCCMQRSGNCPSVAWGFASIPFHMAPGIGWRLHMSRIASEICQPAHRYAGGMVRSSRR
jgi:hypothetical protein